MILAVAALCGGLAATLRYAISLWFAGRGSLPFAVLLVNAVGSGFGGVVAGLATTGVVSHDLRLVLIGGIAGGLTTFSTWSVETVQLIEEGRWRGAVASVLLNLLLGLGLAIAGYLLAVSLG